MSARKIVSIVGDAGVVPGNAAYDAALELGRLAVDAGFRVMTGGLGGVMEAACKGAHGSSRYSDGDTIGLLPGFDPAEANDWVDVAVATGLGHLRNGIVANADAVVAIGGGAGTLSEIALAWQLKRLVVALPITGWSLDLAGRRIDDRRRCPDVDDDHVFRAEDPGSAIALIEARLASYPRCEGHGLRGRSRPGRG